MKQKRSALQYYFDNLQVLVNAAVVGPVPESWEYLNIVPSFNRLYFILEGEGRIEIDGKIYYPVQNQLVIMPAGVPLSISKINENRYVKYWVHFHAFVGELELFQLINIPYVLTIQNIPAVKACLDELIQHHKSDSILAPLMQKTAMLQLLTLFFKEAGTEHIQLNPSPLTQLISTVTEYIEKHLHEPISVEDLAGLVHLHPNYFIQQFKTSLGLTPIQYVNKLRIERIKKLLITTGKTVSEIADELGVDLSYLSRLFKKHTGFTPTEYRIAITGSSS